MHKVGPMIFYWLIKSTLTNLKWNSLTGGDAAETGSGPGSYDIRKSVWHVNVSRRIFKNNNI